MPSSMIHWILKSKPGMVALAYSRMLTLAPTKGRPLATAAFTSSSGSLLENTTLAWDTSATVLKFICRVKAKRSKLSSST